MPRTPFTISKGASDGRGHVHDPETRDFPGLPGPVFASFETPEAAKHACELARLFTTIALGLACLRAAHEKEG